MYMFLSRQVLQESKTSTWLLPGHHFSRLHPKLGLKDLREWDHAIIGQAVEFPEGPITHRIHYAERPSDPNPLCASALHLLKYVCKCSQSCEGLTCSIALEGGVVNAQAGGNRVDAASSGACSVAHHLRVPYHKCTSLLVKCAPSRGLIPKERRAYGRKGKFTRIRPVLEPHQSSASLERLQGCKVARLQHLMIEPFCQNLGRVCSYAIDKEMS